MAARKDAVATRAVRARRGRRKPLDARAVERVVALIRAWPALPLTWEVVVRAVAAAENGGWSRQSLSGNERISRTYKDRHSALSAGRTRIPRDPAAVVLQNLNRDLNARLAEMEQLLRQYEERFLTILRNASARGISQEMLEGPLDPINRRAR